MRTFPVPVAKTIEGEIAIKGKIVGPAEKRWGELREQIAEGAAADVAGRFRHSGVSDAELADLVLTSVSVNDVVNVVGKPEMSRYEFTRLKIHTYERQLRRLFIAMALVELAIIHAAILIGGSTLSNFGFVYGIVTIVSGVAWGTAWFQISDNERDERFKNRYHY